MKTNTTLRLLSSVILSSLGFFQVNAQHIQATASSAAPHKNEERSLEKLGAEIYNMSERAVKLRSRSRLAEGETKDVMLREAATLEREGLSKQIEYSSLSYAMHQQTVKNNRAILSSMLKNGQPKENQMHFKFLQEDSEKNIRIAEQLYEEAGAQKTTANKIGSLENAEEKIATAISQQEQAIDILKNSNKLTKAR